MPSFLSMLLFISVTMPGTLGNLPTPVKPARPTPYFSWDTVPVAYHGANKKRMYTAKEVELIATRYQMVTLEKWYTPCAADGKAGPECNVEEKMLTTFKAIKKVNPNVTTMFYLNSMFNFAFYNLNGLMMQREAEGKTSLLRDRNGTLVSLCNDGNTYCNITTFDLSVPEVRNLWLEAIVNMTRDGVVDGVFADHGYEQGNQPSRHDLLPPEDPQLCNGKGELRVCYHFDPDFALKFNDGHEFILNNTQDVVAKLTRGPVIDGPYGVWNLPIGNLNRMRDIASKGKSGSGPFVLEFNRGEPDNGCNPNTNSLAAFLIAAEKYSYMACYHSQETADEPLPEFLEDFKKPLGEPTGPAEQGPTNIYTRRFISFAGVTVVTYDNRAGHKNGSIQWASENTIQI